MVMKRTTVFAEEDDLAVLRAAAESQGVTEAELVRRAIHLAALAERRWEEPFFRSTYEPLVDGDADSVLTGVYDEMADRFEHASSQPR